MALQILSLPREGRSANVEPAPETESKSATMKISDPEIVLQVKRLDDHFPTTRLVNPNDSTLTMDRTLEALPGRATPYSSSASADGPPYSRAL